MMMVPTRKARCVPDPTLGVGDLMKALRADLAQPELGPVAEALSPKWPKCFILVENRTQSPWMVQI